MSSRTRDKAEASYHGVKSKSSRRTKKKKTHNSKKDKKHWCFSFMCCMSPQIDEPPTPEKVRKTSNDRDEVTRRSSSVRMNDFNESTPSMDSSLNTIKIATPSSGHQYIPVDRVPSLSKALSGLDDAKSNSFIKHSPRKKEETREIRRNDHILHNQISDRDMNIKNPPSPAYAMSKTKQTEIDVSEIDTASFISSNSMTDINRKSLQKAVSQHDSRERNLTNNRMSNGSGNGDHVVPTATSSGSTFAESNKMFDVIGVRFDRNQLINAGDRVVNLGDSHLLKLEETCKQLLLRSNVDKQRNLARTTNGIGNTISLPHGSSGISHNNGAIVPSTKFVEISIAFTEVLQLQGRPKEAVQVLSKAIEEVNTDMSDMRQRRMAGKSKSSPLPVIAFSESSVSGSLLSNAVIPSGGIEQQPTTEEYEQLKRLKSICHRRIGSLYVTLGKFKDAEDHLKKYLSYIEKLPSSASQLTEHAYTYSVLACIYDQMGRKDDAIATDNEAIKQSTLAREAEP